jgi:hypothetical protein
LVGRYVKLELSSLKVTEWESMAGDLER